MARIAGSSGARTAEAIREAGLQLIYEHGYEAMNLRQLAQAVGLQPSSLYNHISSKQELLFRIISEHMEDLIRRARIQLDVRDASPLDRLRIFIAHHLRAHIKKKREVYVANFELRALSKANRPAVLDMRTCYEQILITILDEGVRDQDLAVVDTHVAAYALLAMLTGACTWYKPEGRLTEEQVVDLHTTLVLHGYARHGAADGIVAAAVAKARHSDPSRAPGRAALSA